MTLLAALVSAALSWFVWCWIRKQQERDEQQAAEDRGIV